MRTGKDGWLRCEIDRETLRALMRRSDARGITQMLWFFGPLLITGIGAGLADSPLVAATLFWIYGSIYGFCNSLLHETHHATAFRSRKLNEVVHFVAGLMTLRNPVYDRRMHTLHHGNTSHAGSDPELANANPVSIWRLMADLFWLRAAARQPVLLVRQLLGRFTPEERKVIPPSERPAVRRQAAAIIAFYLFLVAISLWQKSWLPLLYTFLAHIYGGFVPRLYSLTQHVGLADSGKDYRINSRTCYYNPVVSAWYWNMNYHVEHHMFPLVPFHALPELHRELKSQMPKANTSVVDAWQEILSCVLHQRKHPDYAIYKQVPEQAPQDAGTAVKASA